MAQVTVQDGARTFNGVEIPPAGRYAIDRSHSMVEAIGRHLMVTKVRGRFTEFSGEIIIGEDPLQSSAQVTVDAASVDTGDERRDEHLRGEDFLAVDEFPTLEFRSTRLAPRNEGWILEGDLTIRGVTRRVSFDVSYDGYLTDPWGKTRVAFSATTEINREDWGLTWNMALETGGVLVGKKITIDLTIAAIRSNDNQD